MTISLIERLAAVYAVRPIRHPALKAVTLAQWLVESGRGSSDLATQHLNFAGIKWRPELAGYATRVRYAAHDGIDWYCKFASLESFIHGYWACIDRAPYRGWEDHAGSAADYIGFVGPIYTPTPGYAAAVLALVGEAQGLLDSTARADLVDLGTLVLDPGHGGSKDVGGSACNHATSISGVAEKTLTLAFCLLLRDLLLARAAAAGQRVEVVLTRSSDVNLGIADRAALAGRHQAKALLCLHFNGWPKPGTRGAETYYADAGHPNQNPAADKAFAAAVHAGWLAGMKAIEPGAVDRGVRPESMSGPGGLGILHDDVLGNARRQHPCVGAYLEAEFITNPTVEKLLVSGPDALANRKKALAPLADALLKQLASLPA